MDPVISNVPSFGILGASAPTRCCGPARFGAALTSGLTAYGANVSVVRVSDGAPSLSTRVIGELINDSPASVAACAELLNQSDIAALPRGPITRRMIVRHNDIRQMTTTGVSPATLEVQQ